MSFLDRLFKSDNKQVIEQTRPDTGFNYVCQCRLNTFADITPSNTDFINTDDYKKVIELGYQYIEENGLSGFAGFFQGDQYFVELWTAHIIFDHDEVSEELKSRCIEIISKYSDNPLSPNVSFQEYNWLKNNL